MVGVLDDPAVVIVGESVVEVYLRQDRVAVDEKDAKNVIKVTRIVNGRAVAVNRDAVSGIVIQDGQSIAPIGASIISRLNIIAATAGQVDRVILAIASGGGDSAY